MASTQTAQSANAVDTSASARERFLQHYEREHATTMRVLRAFPADKKDMRPHPNCRTARELAWVFVVERGLGALVWEDAFGKGTAGGETPAPPESWDDVLAALEQAHTDFGNLVRSTSEEKLAESVKFFSGPKTLGDVSRMDFAWFLLFDQIHHRGQFSIYLRVADAKVPSIYGPSADEPWF